MNKYKCKCYQAEFRWRTLMDVHRAQYGQTPKYF